MPTITDEWIRSQIFKLLTEERKFHARPLSFGVIHPRKQKLSWRPPASQHPILPSIQLSHISNATFHNHMTSESFIFDGLVKLSSTPCVSVTGGFLQWKNFNFGSNRNPARLMPHPSECPFIDGGDPYPRKPMVSTVAHCHP